MESSTRGAQISTTSSRTGCYHYGSGEDDAWCKDKMLAGPANGMAFHFTPFGTDGTCGPCSCCKKTAPPQWGEGNLWACYHYGWGEDDRWCQEKARAPMQGGVAFHYTPSGSDATCGGCSCCKCSAANDCFQQTDGADATEVSPEEWSAANKWFDAEVSVFAIVMPNRKDRLELLQARWSKEGVKFEVTPGIDVTAPGASREAKGHGACWLQHVQSGDR